MTCDNLKMSTIVAYPETYKNNSKVLCLYNKKNEKKYCRSHVRNFVF